MAAEDTDSPTLKGIYLWVRSSIVLICFAIISALIIWGVRLMDGKDQRNREDLQREREMSDRVLEREMERNRQANLVTTDWLRKGIENQASKTVALTAKIEDLIVELKGKEMVRELLPMPREIQ